MGVAFTDALIALSSPSCRAEFKRDPDSFLSGRGLSDGEVEALLAGDGGPMWLHARSTTTNDPLQQFNRFVEGDGMVINVEPLIEAHVENLVEHLMQLINSVAVNPLGQLIVDEEGRVYRVVEDDLHNTAAK
jgi:hypothetical protein